MRARASASATREVSMVIQRRPHCSATIGRGARAAGRIEHKVAGVGGHEEAALDHLRQRLNDIQPIGAKSARLRVGPNIEGWRDGVIIEVVYEAEGLALSYKAISSRDFSETVAMSFPVRVAGRLQRPTRPKQRLISGRRPIGKPGIRLHHSGAGGQQLLATFFLRIQRSALTDISFNPSVVCGSLVGRVSNVWKFPGGVLRACEVASDQAARSSAIGSMG